MHNSQNKYNKKSLDEKLIRVNLLYTKSYKKLPKICNQIIHLAGDARTFVNNKNGIKQINDNTKITKNLIRYAIKSKCKKNYIFIQRICIFW